MHFTDLTVFSFALRFSNNGSHTLRYRLRDITTPVRLMTLYRDKEIAGSSHPAVQRHLAECAPVRLAPMERVGRANYDLPPVPSP